jgi:serine phosphatase RsbU (regulator of sigma subunit)
MALYKSAMQNELQQVKDRMETILQSMGEGVIVTGMNGFIEYINANALKLLDRTEPLTGATSLFKMLAVLDPRTGEPTPLNMDKVVLEGGSVTMTDCIMVTEYERRFSADLDIEPLRGEKGAIRGMVLTFRDVSGRKTIPELISRELRDAAAVHQNLLPLDGTSIGDFTLQGFMIAASFGGGDLYNFYRIDEGHAGLYIVDVMGHGVAASSMSLLISRLLTPDPESGNRLSILDVDPLRPGAVVERLNDLLFSSGLLFFTICYGVIDLATGTLRMVRAGHPRPLLVQAGGASREIEPGGNAIGLTRKIVLPEFSVGIGPGDRLLLYTDGLTECVDEGFAPFGRERLLGLAEAAARKPLGETVSRIKESVTRWRENGSFDDDITCIVLERSAPAG